MAQKKKNLKQREHLQCHWHCPCEYCRTDETLQELIELARKASPVANTVSRPTPVNVKLVR